MDLEKIKKANHLATVITIITNSDDFSEVTLGTTCEVGLGSDILFIGK